MTCASTNRQIGIEVETLVIDSNNQPITRQTSQTMFQWLIDQQSWQATSHKGGFVITLQKGDFTLLYELGWNNLELTTPAMTSLPKLLEQTTAALSELNEATNATGSKILPASYDGCVGQDTLMLPDDRDRIWVDLDGPALSVLGHIASVHLNIDLTSIEEGLALTARYLELFERGEDGWPDAATQDIRNRYITESTADYEPDRYGNPPLTFDAYCQRLAEMKVVMNQGVNGLEIASPARPFAANKEVDIDLFLRSIWWRTRLRVRGDKLVLELRDIPRTTDEQLKKDVMMVCKHLGLI